MVRTLTTISLFLMLFLSTAVAQERLVQHRNHSFKIVKNGEEWTAQCTIPVNGQPASKILLKRRTAKLIFLVWIKDGLFQMSGEQTAWGLFQKDCKRSSYEWVVVWDISACYMGTESVTDKLMTQPPFNGTPLPDPPKKQDPPKKEEKPKKQEPPKKQDPSPKKALNTMALYSESGYAFKVTHNKGYWTCETTFDMPHSVKDEESFVTADRKLRGSFKAFEKLLKSTIMGNPGGNLWGVYSVKPFSIIENGPRWTIIWEINKAKVESRSVIEQLANSKPFRPEPEPSKGDVSVLKKHNDNTFIFTERIKGKDYTFYITKPTGIWMGMVEVPPTGDAQEDLMIVEEINVVIKAVLTNFCTGKKSANVIGFPYSSKLGKNVTWNLQGVKFDGIDLVGELDKAIKK